MLSYSVAIRSLAQSPYLKEVLESLFYQSIIPQKVFIFLPEGTSNPEFHVASEEYAIVKKGMMHQRLLPYEEISSDCILMLDDDVSLQPDSVEKLLKAMEENNADLVGADTFQNHKLPLSKKIKAVFSNLVFPHFSPKWAFRIHSNGSFSYIIKPKKNYYPSQSCAGNAMLWKTESYKKLRMQNELWLDSLPFAYSDDMLESYKVYKNGMKLGVIFNSGIRHLDAKSASGVFRRSASFIRKRTMAQIAVWYRTCYNPGNSSMWKKSLASASFSFKMICQFAMFLCFSIATFKFSYISNFIKGTAEGWNFVNSESFKNLPPYVIR